MSQDIELERALPSSPENERAILGTIILDNTLIAQAIDLLKPADFYMPSHRRIFLAMLALFERGSEIKPALIAAELKKDNSLESVGGMAFLVNLSNDVLPVSSLLNYAEVVRGKSLLRQLVKGASKITSEALEEEEDPNVVLEHAQQVIFGLRDHRDSEGRSARSFKEITQKAKAHLAELNSEHNSAIATPWKHLNNACRGGLNPTELWGMISPQKMGKSALAKQLSVFAARNGHRILYFSREMSDLKIFYRALAPLTDIPVSQIRYGLDENRIRESVAAMADLEDLGIFIDTYTSDIEDVRIRAREMVRTENINLIVADYTNQFSARVRKSANRAEEVATIWRGWKNISQEFNIATLALGHPTEILGHVRKNDERKAPFFHQSAESREAAKAVDVGLVLWTEMGDGVAGARPAKLYIDYQRDEDAGGVIDLMFNGRIMEFNEPRFEG
jgi:replicative DNA helicase